MSRLPRVALTARLAAAAVALALVLAPSASAEIRKTNLPPPPPPEVKPETKFKPGSGFTLAQGEDFSLQVMGRVQARWEYFNPDDDRTDIGETYSRFTVERVRFGAKGTMFKDWKFELETDFGKGKTELKKAFIEWAKYEPARIEMGQFNVKFDRSQYTSSGRQELVDRSLAARTFGHEYDIGVDVAGAGWNKKFQYNAGIFEGEKAPTPASPNNNDGHLYVARFSFNPNGDFGYSEGDIKKTDYHLWYVDVAGARNEDLWNDANSDKEEQKGELTDQTTYSFGFGYKHAGWFFAGEYYDRNTVKGDDSSDVDSNGWYAQLGYTIVRDKWEIAARWSEIDPDGDKDDDTQDEAVIGLNRFFKGLGHSLKLQTDFSWLETEKAAPADDFHDFRIRSQMQLVF
jgi:phosphate-selective porin